MRKLPEGIDQAAIIADYNTTKSAYKTAKNLGISDKTVYRILALNDVPAVGIQVYRDGATKFPPEVRAEIRRKYDEGETLESLVTLYGGSQDSIRTAIRKAGGKTRPPAGTKPRPLTDEEKSEAIRLRREGRSSTAIAAHLGRSQTTVSRLLQSEGLASGRAPSRHFNYKGGRATMRQGYVLLAVENDDPLASMRNAAGYVFEHRLVVARHIGRPLREDETVHHINGDRSDNRIENLQLRQGKHGKHACFRCGDCGSQNIVPAEIGVSVADRKPETFEPFPLTF